MDTKLLYSILLVLVAIVAVNATLKEIQKQKHDQTKNHNKKQTFGHGHKSKLEHVAVKEVLKHAPRTLTHHEAKLQADLGHSSGKKQLQTGKDLDIKLQDLTLEDKIHHKIQSHKLHGINRDQLSHNINTNKVSDHKNVGHIMKPTFGEPATTFHGGRSYNNGRTDKKSDKKSSKKILNSSKNKKYKRAKRLHKFIW